MKWDSRENLVWQERERERNFLSLLSYSFLWRNRPAWNVASGASCCLQEKKIQGIFHERHQMLQLRYSSFSLSSTKHDSLVSVWQKVHIDNFVPLKDLCRKNFTLFPSFHLRILFVKSSLSVFFENLAFVMRRLYISFLLTFVLLETEWIPCNKQ